MFFKRRPQPPAPAAKPETAEHATKPARSHQRRYYRAPVDLAVTYTLAGRQGKRGATMSDLSGGGLRLETDEDILPELDVTVKFALPASAHVLTATGHVVLTFWNPLHDRLSHGIAFTAINNEDQERIVHFIHEVQVEELRKRRKLEE